MQEAPFHATTVLGVLGDGVVALGADGQATLGETVAKSHVRKVRRLHNDDILAAFAGSTADSFALVERFEEKLSQYGGVMKRAAIELAKDWRMERSLRQLNAMMIVMNQEEGLLLTGVGDVLEPENGILAIGSGGNYALAAALALRRHQPELSPEDVVREGLTVASELCIYTNANFTIETLPGR